MAKLNGKTGTGAVLVSTTIEEDAEILNNYYEVLKRMSDTLRVDFDDVLNLTYLMEQYVGKTNEVTLQQLVTLEKFNNKYNLNNADIDVYGDQSDEQPRKGYSDKNRINLMRDCLARQKGRNNKSLSSIKTKARNDYTASYPNAGKKAVKSESKYKNILDVELFGNNNGQQEG